MLNTVIPQTYAMYRIKLLPHKSNSRKPKYSNAYVKVIVSGNIKVDKIPLLILQTIIYL